LRHLALAAVAALLAGCMSLPPPRGSSAAATVPEAPPVAPTSAATPPPLDIDSIPDAVPRAEPRSAHGNPPFYDVFGQRYVVLPSSEGYVERGVASWYGPTFHGKSTSSGEPYDMYAMTAAHRTLPLPCYARITNLSNGRSVIVRINDRGPFASNRIIDLSYTAAAKLDIIRPGTAFVELRTISTIETPVPAVPPIDTAGASAQSTGSGTSTPAGPGAGAGADTATPSPGPANAGDTRETSAAPASAGAPAPTHPVSLYVQVGAYSDPVNASKVAARIEAAGIGHVYQASISSAGKTVQRVRVGPVSSVAEFDALVARLTAIGFPGARIASE
jgi:rare lipoprotein A